MCSPVESQLAVDREVHSDDGFIQIRGARTHNLKNVNVDIPRNKFVVITGVSGSGKSSLAFDTLLAEGQRQYIESLSVYARQFCAQMQRPDVDRIDGLQPTIAIDQRPGVQNPRSTVATVTEIYDYLRLLMARLGEVHCPKCDARISQQTPAEIEALIEALPEETRVMVLAPLIRGRKGSHTEIFERIRKAGFVRARVDGQTYLLEDVPPLVSKKTHDVEAVIDRVVVRKGIKARLGESVRLALKHGDGVLVISYQTPDKRARAENKTDTTDWQLDVYNTRYACPRCQASIAEIEPRTFSFNSPHGACPTCSGLGASEGFDPDLVLPDDSLSLGNGAIFPWRGGSAGAKKRQRQLLADFCASAKVDIDQPLKTWPGIRREQLLHGDGKKFPGLLPHLEMDYAGSRSETTRDRLEAYRSAVACSDCQGHRLCPEAIACRFQGMAIHEVTALTVHQAVKFFDGVEFSCDEKPIGEPVLREINRRLVFLEKVGADYLTLDRTADTLSGGETQRVRLATGIGSGLVGVLYLLDEPSIGLHPRDNNRLIAALRELQQQGNSVVVVEHDEAVMRQADEIIDMGPGAGLLGGQVVAQAPSEQFALNPRSLTAEYLSGKRVVPIPGKRRLPDKKRLLSLEGATTNNLHNVSISFPLGLFTCVTGVSGSGKSSLVIETLGRALAQRLHGASSKPGPYRRLRGVSLLDRAIRVDQAPIGRTPRSNAATYTGVFDEVRKVFASTRQAKQRGYKIGRFSFNVKGGRCDACQGQGLQKIEMNFLPDLFVTCEVCRGTRFNRQTLSIKYRGHSIAEALEMSVEEAVEFFANHASIHRLLCSLADVGLGYLALGQPSTTLSGGEAQRIKLATELGRSQSSHAMYILDEPTTGLHTDDIGRLLVVLQRLVDQGNSVVVIEHNLDVIKSADWVIDMGPEGGAEGGDIVVEGPPEEVVQCAASHTGSFLRNAIAGRMN